MNMNPKNCPRWSSSPAVLMDDLGFTFDGSYIVGGSDDGMPQLGWNDYLGHKLILTIV